MDPARAGAGADQTQPSAGSRALPSVGGAYEADLDSAITFSPVYSAYDGVHGYRVPVTVEGYAGIDWDTDRPDLVDLEPVDANTVMITTRGAGTARIIARAGALSGSTELTITAFEPGLWAIGEALFNENMAPPPPEGSFVLPDDISCRNCHGSGAEALSIEYTPQQTGGYSDEVLIGIITRGQKPPRANWRSNIPMFIYTMVHSWPDVSDEDALGLLSFLRSLVPTTQGEIDFGGL